MKPGLLVGSFVAFLALAWGSVVLFRDAIPEYNRANKLDHEAGVAIALVDFDDSKPVEGLRMATYRFQVHGTQFTGRAWIPTTQRTVDVRYLRDNPKYSSPDSAANARTIRVRIFNILTFMTLVCVGCAYVFNKARSQYQFGSATESDGVT